MASELKRRKVQRETENSPSITYNVRHWISAIMSLCTNNYMTHISLTPLKIQNCNATASGGTSFSKVFCETIHYDEGLVFGDLFQKGMEVLVNYVQKKTLPASKQLQVVLQKLLDFLDGGKYFSSTLFNDKSALINTFVLHPFYEDVNILAHLSWKLKWALLSTCRLSVCL